MTWRRRRRRGRGRRRGIRITSKTIKVRCKKQRWYSERSEMPTQVKWSILMRGKTGQVDNYREQRGSNRGTEREMSPRVVSNTRKIVVFLGGLSGNRVNFCSMVSVYRWNLLFDDCMVGRQDDRWRYDEEARYRKEKNEMSSTSWSGRGHHQDRKDSSCSHHGHRI